MQACFIGHRNVEKTEKLVQLLRETMISLVNNGVYTFLFGGTGEFDHFAWEIASRLKKEYAEIKRVYVRSQFPVIDDDYKQYLLTLYDETYFPQEIANAGKFVHVERNYLMIDSCDCCVFYYDKQYTPPPSNNYRRNDLLPTQNKTNSGTKLAYEYAVKKKKRIINLYDNDI